jgi:hypothetical protein
MKNDIANLIITIYVYEYIYRYNMEKIHTSKILLEIMVIFRT